MTTHRASYVATTTPFASTFPPSIAPTSPSSTPSSISLASSAPSPPPAYSSNPYFEFPPSAASSSARWGDEHSPPATLTLEEPKSLSRKSPPSLLKPSLRLFKRLAFLAISIGLAWFLLPALAPWVFEMSLKLSNVPAPDDFLAAVKMAAGSKGDAWRGSGQAGEEAQGDRWARWREGWREQGRRLQKLAVLVPDRGLPPRFKYGANFISDRPLSSSSDGTNLLLTKPPSPQRLASARASLKKDYLTSVRFWREYQFKTPEIDGSFREVEVGLGEDERAVREGVREARRMRAEWARGVGLKAGEGGLAVRSKSDDDSPTTSPWHLGYLHFSHSRHPSSRPSSAEDHPLASFSAPTSPYASSEKWSSLLAESRAASLGLSPHCTASSLGYDVLPWMAAYAARHYASFSPSSSFAAPEKESAEGFGKYVTYICEGGTNCGGLGDRLLGMTSAFLFALVTDRAFTAEWQSPLPLDVVFDSPWIDWSFASFVEEIREPLGEKELKEAGSELDMIHVLAEEMDGLMGTRAWDANIPSEGKRMTKGKEGRDLAFASPWVKWFSNRGLVYRSFSYAHLRHRLTTQPSERGSGLGLHPHTAFSCLLSYLFEPKPAAREMIDTYTSLFSLPTVFTVGIQIRTGDRSLKDPAYDQRFNTLERHKEFFRCAEELTETYAIGGSGTEGQGQKIVYFLVTDSKALREDARKRWKRGSSREWVVVSGLDAEHVHQKEGHAEGVFNAVIEEWILAHTDYRVITQDSGFGKLASFMATKPRSTVALFPRHNTDVLKNDPIGRAKAEAREKALKKGGREAVDCRLDSAFVSFEELSSEWSLG